MASAGQPTTPMIPVRGGAFGADTEASISQILDAAFGEGATAALQEIATKKGKDIATERVKAEKAEADKVAKEEAAKNPVIKPFAASAATSKPGPYPRTRVADGTEMEFRDGAWRKVESGPVPVVPTVPAPDVQAHSIPGVGPGSRDPRMIKTP